MVFFYGKIQNQYIHFIKNNGSLIILVNCYECLHWFSTAFRSFFVYRFHNKVTIVMISISENGSQYFDNSFHKEKDLIVREIHLSPW